ncbi:hypothetical protein C8Q80DRAFT_1200487 [Daedaleopsis nitida]|nr:hypothetical protein C8Q80DRAFT_1200487 [Daedaleopsis nitida]
MNPNDDPAPIPPQSAMVPDEDIPFKAYVARVFEIIPDVLPAHVFSLVEQQYPTHKDNVVEAVLHTLFENPDYPKVDAKGKRKREDDQPAQRAVEPKIDYGDKNRTFEGGPHYATLAAELLEQHFLDIPTSHIRLTFNQYNTLYAPTYLALHEQQRSHAPPYKPMVRPRNKGKGKRIHRIDALLDEEVQWVKERPEQEAQPVAEELRPQDEGGIECGCCFSEYSFDKMVQCPEAHLFCTSCMMTYAETKLGEHDMRIVCMDQSGCKLLFPESEMRRFLTPKLLELYERVKQRKEIEAAGLEGLEECPFCEYKVIIENEQERLFRCENDSCGAVTCRQCKKLSVCRRAIANDCSTDRAEVDNDGKLDVRHAIEEAMTRALMRNCPKCQKAFVKEMGCNKMTCPKCATLSCYICRKAITGYDHFDNPPPYTGRPDLKKCPLWDSSVEGRHSDEVAAAAKKALEDFKRAHPELDEKEISVDLPLPPPAAAASSRNEGIPLARAPLPAGIHVPLINAVPGSAHLRAHEAQWRNNLVNPPPQPVLQHHPIYPHHAMGINMQFQFNQPPQPAIPAAAARGPPARPKRSTRKKGAREDHRS